MENYVKQHLYTRDNLHKYFLSPYVYIVRTDESLFIGREEDDREFSLNENTEAWISIFRLLAEGMDEDELMAGLNSVVPQEDVEDVFAWLIQGGIIE